MALVTLALPQRVDPLTRMAFVLVPAGSFEMGSPSSEKDREPQETRHPMTIARAFYLAVREVTQEEWRTVMGGNPSSHLGCDACPVERITYLDVERFLERLNARSRWPGFRLPTEAEWEIACRAGGTAAYGARDAIDRGTANATCPLMRTSRDSEYEMTHSS